MQLTDIVNRNKYNPVHELEMVYVIKEYIYEKKGVYVDILTTKHPRAIFNLDRHMSQLLYAFETACNYFKSK